MIFTSFIDIPRWACVDHKYLNRSASSSVFLFIHIPYVGRWSWLDSVDGDFCWFPCRVHPLFSPVCQWVVGVLLQASQHIDVVSKPQVAKRSSPDECWGVKAFCIFFSMNILNSRPLLEIMDIPAALQLSFERNLRHLHLVTQRVLLHRKTTRWPQSTCCRCYVLLRLARCNHRYID